MSTTGIAAQVLGEMERPPRGGPIRGRGASRTLGVGSEGFATIHTVSQERFLDLSGHEAKQLGHS